MPQKEAGHCKMHHEVLLALSGYPGHTFAVSRESGLFEVVPGLPFIHPSEINLLNRISRLGTYYLQLKEFISQQTEATLTLRQFLPNSADSASIASPGSRKQSGLYLKALAHGIDRVLEGYRQQIVRVEKKCIEDPHLPLSHLQSEFEQYQLLLPSLDACVKHIHRHKLYGCLMLSYLHQQCSSGVPIIHEAFVNILAVCHGVLYKQLSAWMLHGMLADREGEFFIEENREPQSHSEASSSESSDKTERTSSSQKSDDESEKEDKSGCQFAINPALVPAYIPFRVIEKILFVGEAVKIFQRKSDGGPSLSTTLTGAGSQLRLDQFKFTHRLAELQRQPVFQLREFESVIDSIRDCIAEHLWKLLVEDSDLMGHLQIMKNFYLLGRGELYLAFIDLAHSFMRLPPTTTCQHDVNIAFQQAMLKIGLDNEDLMKQFKLTVIAPQPKRRGPPLPLSRAKEQQQQGPSPAETKKPGWSSLGLTHTVEWPLHILFTPAMLEKYDGLFRFLLLLRRAQIALQQIWALLMQYRRKAEELRPVWELRTHMGFLVDNLQYYVQVDVLEAQFTQLTEKIQSTHDFESIKHAHESFVTTLQSQLFFTMPAVLHCLREILELCHTFTSLLQWRDELTLSPKDWTEIDRIAKDFKRQSSLFFQIVSSYKSHHSAPHLAQLLLRIDYNKFFSSHDTVNTSSATLVSTTTSMS